MVWRALLTLLLTAGWFFGGSPRAARAQDDPNAQYILVQSGELPAGTREIALPVEVGALRMHVHLQAGPELQWSLLTPAGRPLTLTDPNISLSESAGRRTISIWDPRPGLWKIRLAGAGRFTVSAVAQGELYICCAQFWARTGVYSLDRFQPARGSRHQAQVYVSGFNIDTVEFDLVTEQGDRLAPLKFRQGDFSNPYNLTVFIDAPDRPFRLRARGRDMSGKSYQRVFPWLIHPTAPESAPSAGEAAPNAPQWTPPQEWNKAVVESEFQIVRAHVLNVSDQMLRTEKGNPIGMRITYAVRFPIDGSYAPLPQVYPERIGSGFTGALQMRVQKGSIEPAPEGVSNPGQVFFGARAAFRRDVTYTFTVDLVPNYAVYNDAQRSFCLTLKSYAVQGLRERFDREAQSEQRYRYRLSFTGTDLDGRTPTLTESLYVPRVWYQGFQREGVGECP